MKKIYKLIFSILLITLIPVIFTGCFFKNSKEGLTLKEINFGTNYIYIHLKTPHKNKYYHRDQFKLVRKSGLYTASSTFYDIGKDEHNDSFKRQLETKPDDNGEFVLYFANTHYNFSNVKLYYLDKFVCDIDY